jgi:hypothetical protein
MAVADNVESILLRKLEAKVCKLDESLIKMSDGLTDFMRVQAAHEERMVSILDQVKDQRLEVSKLRDLVLPISARIATNKTMMWTIIKLLIVILTSGAAGGVVTKILGI